MKAKRERYTIPISVASYEKMRDEALMTGLDQGSRQGIAAAMYTLWRKYGWRGKRLRDFYDAIDDTLHMPDIFGVSPTAGGAIEMMKGRYQIDIDKLDIRVSLEG